jgi:hypothetical protein
MQIERHIYEYQMIFHFFTFPQQLLLNYSHRTHLLDRHTTAFLCCFCCYSELNEKLINNSECGKVHRHFNSFLSISSIVAVVVRQSWEWIFHILRGRQKWKRLKAVDWRWWHLHRPVAIAWSNVSVLWIEIIIWNKNAVGLVFFLNCAVWGILVKKRITRPV